MTYVAAFLLLPSQSSFIWYDKIVRIWLFKSNQNRYILSAFHFKEELRNVRKPL